MSGSPTKSLSRPLAQHDKSPRLTSWPIAHLLQRIRGGVDRRRLLALGLAGLVALLTHRIVAEADATTSSLGSVQRIVVATRNLPSGHLLETGDYTFAERPRAMLPSDTWQGSPDGLVLTESILANEVLVTSRIGTGPFGLLSHELAVTIPPPLAPPPLEIGHQVLLVTVAAPNGAFVRPATTITTGRVLVVSPDAITLAVPAQVANSVINALAIGSIDLILTPG